jgi:hypothetical protein
MLYCVRLLGLGGRETDVLLSRALLEDVRDNPTRPTSQYSVELTTKLNTALLEKIEAAGLISFGEETLKFLLFKFVADEQKSGRTVNKYNAIGKGNQGDFERWLKTELLPEEKDVLIWVWGELVRLRLIAPTGTDLINPDDWVKITDRGSTAVEGKSYTE